MKVVESLENIRRPWLSRAFRYFTRGEELREDVEQLLNHFYNRLLQALETGDAGWLDSLLDDWVQSRTQTDLENREAELPVILNQMLTIAYETASEYLPEHESLSLLGALLPIFLHANEYSLRKEMALSIDHISRELEKANASLERLDKSKSDFISIAAHELKTPLTLIEGYTAMLRERMFFEDLPPQSIIMLKGVDNGTRRLREIVDDMVDVSLIDNNLLSLNFQPVWFNRLFEVLKQEFSQAINERNQIMEINKFSGSEEATFGDNERLHQAFRNVLMNSIKYTPDGGRIVIDGRKLPGFTEITFSDTGIGIASEDHTRIFEKFGVLGIASLHSSGKTKFKGGGPGLGLPITKGIIEAHGGAIWVESSGYDEVNCPGSTFHILLPMRKEPPDDNSAKLFSPLLSDNQDIEVVKIGRGI